MLLGNDSRHTGYYHPTNLHRLRFRDPQPDQLVTPTYVWFSFRPRQSYLLARLVRGPQSPRSPAEEFRLRDGYSAEAGPISDSRETSYRKKTLKARCFHHSTIPLTSALPCPIPDSSHQLPTMSLLDSMQVRAEGTSANGLYSQALVVGNMVFLSGVTGVDPATGNLVEGTVADRTVSYPINCGLFTLNPDRHRFLKISLGS